jgi:hypothetical protein
MRYLCRLGLHQFAFKRPLYVGAGALEVCKRCGKGRILHFAGAYEYFDASGIETQSAKTEGLGPKGESPPEGDAQTPSRIDGLERSDV